MDPRNGPGAPDEIGSPPPARRSLLWKILVGAVLGLGGLLILVLALVLFVVATPPGARWALGLGLARSPFPASVSQIEGTLLGPLTLTGIEVDYRGIDLRVETVVLDWQPTRLLGREVRVDSLFATGVQARVPQELDPAPTPEGPPPEPTAGPPSIPELPVDVQLDSFRVEIAGVEVADRARLDASTLGGSGSLADLHFETRFTGSAAPLESFAGEAAMDGAPEAYTLAAELALSYPDLPPVSATLASSGSLTDLEIQEARIRTADGEARASGSAAWYPEVSWAVDAVADDFQVAPFTPEPEEWPGSISFHLASEGRMAESGVEATAVVDDLSGTVRDQPLSGGVDVRTAGGAVEVRQMEVAWGGLLLDVEGDLVETLDLAFALNVPDLGLALPGSSGSIAVEGSVAGARTEPRLSASLRADAVSRDSLQLDRLRGEVELDLAPGGRNRIALRAAALTSGATTVDSVVVSGDGTRESHRVGLRGWSAENGLGAGLTGGLQGGGETEAPFSWAGTLDSLSIRTEAVGDWGLAEGVAIRGSADSASLGDACLTRSDARACVSGRWSADGGVAGEAQLTALPLSLLAATAPEGIQVDGTLQGGATFALGPEGALTAEGAFEATGGIDATAGEERVRFGLGGEGVRFAVDDEGASASLDLALTPEQGSGDVRASGEIRLPGLIALPVEPEDQPVEGRLEAVSDDLSFLTAFVPPVARASGRMDLQTDLSGTLAQPQILGGMRVEDGEMDLPDFGLELRELTVEAQGEQGGDIALDARVASGDGFLSLTGRMAALPSPETPVELEVSGERFRAVSTPEYQAEIAPDLQVSFDGELTTVRGTLAVPWARIELVEIPEVAVAPSTDVVFLGEEPAPLPQVDARIDISVGDDVFFSGLGFTSGVEGDVRVVQQPGSDPLLQGEFSFTDGRFVAYGQNLDIDPGRVIFAGPPLDASLDVTAERLAQDGTRAGVVVTGPALTPTITLTSDPALSDADALSYIIYGRSLSEGDASQQQRVVGAAATLGANVLTTQLAGSVGLDEARIEGATRETAELVAGKYLSPKIFVAYGRGLFRPTNTFRLKYLLSSSWALQAESGEANGGDVLYQIERGR